MEGKGREGKGVKMHDEMGEIKKGPWKAEEDEVLLNHVKKYGPCDWSSIRSKALLRRTGKSCRLRWVNKLRPNLKNGVKFSPEEEKTVIELQAEFGNKWAKIATHLPGRTDNDVKNFWSSRQKRLARILQTPTPSSSSSSKSLKANKDFLPLFHEVSNLEGPKLSSSTEEESSSLAHSFSSSQFDNKDKLEMVPLPELVDPSLLIFEQNLLQSEFFPVESNSQFHIPFPLVPQPETDIHISLEGQELITRLQDPVFLDVFGNGVSASHDLGIGQLPMVSPCFRPESCRYDGEGDNDNPVTPESFIADFPVDIFDHVEPIPSSPEW